jgi:hypothetical protein
VNSTHGVRVNKNRIEKLTFVPLLAGYVFQIAGKFFANILFLMTAF